jgi:hypothetical protein
MTSGDPITEIHPFLLVTGAGKSARQLRPGDGFSGSIVAGSFLVVSSSELPNLHPMGMSSHESTSKQSKIQEPSIERKNPSTVALILRQQE